MALADGLSLTALIERGLRREVEAPKPSARPRPLVPLSERRGGLLPGVDIDKSSVAQETDDLERLRRSL